MSEAQPIAATPHGGTDNVRAAIARAARATGVDFDYLLAQARLESSLDPTARAGTSSAAGLYQFTSGTWLATLDRHGSSHGLGWAGDAIENGRVRDPAMRAAVMGLRMDADASALMAAELARDNRAELTRVLGREPDAAELYLAHFLGSAGAGRVLGVLATDPDRSAAALLPRAAAANRAIFYEPSGAARSVAGVMELMRGKVAGAMEGGAMPDVPVPAEAGLRGIASGGSLAGIPRPNFTPEGQGPERPSMSETLRASFGLAAADGASAPANVRNAYAALQRFGL